MSANVSLVQNLYAAFGRGVIPAVVAGMAPEVVWTVTGRQTDHPLLGVRKGQKGVEEFFSTLAQVQDVMEFAPREFYAADDKVFALGHYAWTIRKTGRPVSSDFCHIFTIRGGKVISFVEFTDTAKFAEAFRG